MITCRTSIGPNDELRESPYKTTIPAAYSHLHRTQSLAKHSGETEIVEEKEEATDGENDVVAALYSAPRRNPSSHPGSLSIDFPIQISDFSFC